MSDISPELEPVPAPEDGNVGVGIPDPDPYAPPVDDGTPPPADEDASSAIESQTPRPSLAATEG